MTHWIHGSVPGHEVNVVFARGLSVDELCRRLRGLRREPLARGGQDGWAWAVHDMLNGDAEDFDPVDYRALCADGAEIVVFVTEPCSPKGFPPDFEYYRDGRTVLRFSFEDLGRRIGDDPDHLSAELLAANLIGPDAACAHTKDGGRDCLDHYYDDHERLVRTIADHFALPSLPTLVEATAI
ncbi:MULTISPECIES: hypothetical protein [Streptomyces]|uniref:Uncharacterized protein n=1 Tax=Streptomyces cadmiisoli TaxID=2184053 RepID=A0A2Z4J865_9ACTN|nr:MULTISPECIES: hypothetical protein [Streptomyces]AWW41259.1 hypothetical protein DN051_35065 [Streptomyces cadmiisoli]KOV69493.1 hypothetical protein ADL00_10965 [Streptomyces sp. AS58]